MPSQANYFLCEVLPPLERLPERVRLLGGSGPAPDLPDLSAGGGRSGLGGVAAAPRSARSPFMDSRSLCNTASSDLCFVAAVSLTDPSGTGDTGRGGVFSAARAIENRMERSGDVRYFRLSWNRKSLDMASSRRAGFPSSDSSRIERIGAWRSLLMSRSNA